MLLVYYVVIAIRQSISLLLTLHTSKLHNTVFDTTVRSLLGYQLNAWFFSKSFTGEIVFQNLWTVGKVFSHLASFVAHSLSKYFDLNYILLKFFKYLHRYFILAHFLSSTWCSTHTHHSTIITIFIQHRFLFNDAGLLYPGGISVFPNFICSSRQNGICRKITTTLWISTNYILWIFKMYFLV